MTIVPLVLATLLGARAHAGYCTQVDYVVAEPTTGRWLTRLSWTDGPPTLASPCAQTEVHSRSSLRERTRVRGLLRGCPGVRRPVRFRLALAGDCAAAEGWVRLHGKPRVPVRLVAASTTPPTNTTTSTSTTSTSSTSTTAIVDPVCGNGVREGSEACDGNDIGNARCSRGGPVSCLASCLGWNFNDCFWCGNGIREGSEECDGADIGGATCPANSTAGAPTCTFGCRLDVGQCAICGDGKWPLSEECEDGNTVSGDGCSATCKLECGDGVLQPLWEQCDDGNRVFGDGCSSFCEIDRIFGGGGDQADVCALQWWAASSLRLNAPLLDGTLACRDGQSPCDRGPPDDGVCDLLVYFCVNQPSFVGPCRWDGVATVGLTEESLDGPTALDSASQAAVLDACATMLGRWGGATVTLDGPALRAEPRVDRELCGQVVLPVRSGETRTLGVRVGDGADPANTDSDRLVLSCDEAP